MLCGHPLACALNLLYPLHTGDVGGLWLRVSNVLTGVLPAVLLISGVIIWWGRRARRNARSARITPVQASVHRVR
jgi:uncharacterized iron-regulated membrane protein